MAEKVELTEQVPLKSDTEAQENVAEGGVEAQAVPEKKKRYTFFSKVCFYSNYYCKIEIFENLTCNYSFFLMNMM